MRIIHLAAELAPFAKVGGLADVLQGLCGQLAQEGHSVEVWLPSYPCLASTSFASLPFKVVLLSTPGFDRPNIYGYEDDVERFALFTLQACDRLRQESYDVVHAHDWHTALAAKLLPNVVLTLHNLSYAGIFTPSLLTHLGIKVEECYRGQEGYSLLRIGILHAKKITTVSPSYAQEILTTAEGNPFFDLIQQEKGKLVGILNGLDTNYWNPETDSHIHRHYDLNRLEEKQQNQQWLLSHLRLNQPEGPVIAAVTRLVWQKGPEFIETVIDYTCSHNGVFLLLGSVPSDETLKHFQALQKRFSVSMHFATSFNESLAHQIYAGADVLIVPSRFEPCGLTQLIAMRYGTLPLVHQTGGLADTVTEGINGFTFSPLDHHVLRQKCDQIFYLWHHHRSRWIQMQYQAMKGIYSWQQSAAQYLSIYQSISPSATCAGQQKK